MKQITYIAILVATAIVLCLTSCKSVQYVPVETVVTEVVHKTDTVIKTDSVKVEKETIVREARPEDSVMLADMGIKIRDNERIIIMLQKQLEKEKSNVYEQHAKDSVRVDSIQVPYPVEKPLTKWQKFCIDYGKITFGVSIAAVIALLVWAFFKLRKKFFIS